MTNEQQPDDDQVQLAEGGEDEAQTDSQIGTDTESGSTTDNGATPTAEELMLTLQDAQAKADEYWNQLLLARADLTNMQRRAERDLENAHKFGLEKFVRELLPVKDSLELGLTAANGKETDLNKLREGMEMTLKLFGDAVGKFGVTEIDPVGEPFNPEFHQAMTTQPAGDGVEVNTVMNVFQKGYLLNDRLIRPAMVVVAK
jgi:molecular chaperone GrpE